MTTAKGCVNKVTEVITVNPNEVSFELPEGPICTYTPIAFAGAGESVTGWSWAFGDGNTSTSENHQHTYTRDGEYQVRLTVENSFGCTNTRTENISVGICVGVEDQMREEQIRLYPNPSTGEFTVALDWTGKGVAQIQVMNATGKTVMVQQLTQARDRYHTFDVSALPDGLYVVKIRADKGIITRKLVIRK